MDTPSASKGILKKGWQVGETAFLALALLLMAVLPVAELAGRKFFHAGIRGSHEYLQHLTLWVGFLGALLATRENKHLKIGAALHQLPQRARPWVEAWTGFVSVAICFGLTLASVALIVSEAPGLPEPAAGWIPTFIQDWLEPFGLFAAGSGTTVAGWIPVWVAELVMPVGFFGMAIRFALKASPVWWHRILVAMGMPAIVLLGILFSESPEMLVWPLVIILMVTAILGAPIFIVLGGAAIVFFFGEYVPIAAIPTETYRIVSSPIFPTIPLFTLAGFILSESKASERLVRVFQAFFGWIPGGLAVAATLLCAFFTTFTGASGVTILALGGLLLPVLVKGGFKEDFSIGLLTSTGSLGLLLPPSLVVILYGVMARVPITDMFVAGLLPGILLILPIVLLCMWRGVRSGTARTPFDLKEAWTAVLSAKWEVAMPFLVLFLIFSGFCTLVESAALLVLYALLVEAVIYRDLDGRAIFQLLVQCATLVGGVLIILGVAMGLTSYLVDAQIPMQAAEWVSTHIESKLLFLLALNLALIMVGCLMDIFSALVVVVPLLLPMAARFGIDPVHLGVIFLANLQLGYLTPPVGMNLFLASFRFKKSLMYVSRQALVFLLIMAVVVLLVTYIPALSIGVLDLLGRTAP